MSSLSGQMAKFAIDLQFQDIPDESIWEAKRFLLDSVGCALAAVNNEDMAAMYRFTEKLGGTPEASVILPGRWITTIFIGSRIPLIHLI